MLQIFNTVEDGLQELDQVTEGCWVALTKPTMEELETVSATTGIDIDDLRAPLDDEERSREEIEYDYVGGHPFLRRKRQVCDDSSWYLYDRKDDCDRMPGRDTGIKSIYEQP